MKTMLHFLGRRPGRSPRTLLRLFATSLLFTTLISVASFAQDDTQKLAERSSIVVLGKVLKTHASEEPLLAASSSTAVITVLEMYAGGEIAGNQKGRMVTVILHQPERLKEGEEMLFFGNPRFVGRTLTIADEGEVPAGGAEARSSMNRGLQVRRDQPVLARLAAATIIFRGAVEKITPLAAQSAEGERSPAHPSEHDPEWQVATVRVITGMRGAEAGQSVTVLFPGSRDIEWFNAPHLRVGQEAVFLAHPVEKEEAERYRNRALTAILEKPSTALVTEPFDVLPASGEERVRGLLAASGKETR